LIIAKILHKEFFICFQQVANKYKMFAQRVAIYGIRTMAGGYHPTIFPADLFRGAFTSLF